MEGGSDGIIAKALKDLMIFWERSEMTWRDEARKDFERDHIAELTPAINSAVGAIQRIDELLRMARKECS